MTLRWTWLVGILALGAACVAVESGDAGPLAPEVNARLVDVGGCLRPEGEPQGPCVPNPEGCASLDVVQDPASGETCQVCRDEAGAVLSRRCGQASSADCVRLEGNYGETCTVCRTYDGEVLYDSCHEAAATAVRCEQLVQSDGQQCELCFDEDGVVQSQTCFADSDNCETWVEGERRCQRCTAGGEVVYQACEPVAAADQARVDPERCSYYSDAQGYDCYVCVDEDGQVVARSCADGQPVGCQSYRTADGSECVICYDRNGAVVSRECAPAEPVAPGESCREYQTDTGRCLICFDSAGQVTRRDCVSACEAAQGIACETSDDCPTGATCADGVCGCTALTDCQLYYPEDGILCEICGDRNGDGVTDERDASCYATPPAPVECWTEVREDATGGGTVTCTVCSSENGGVTEECAADGYDRGDPTCTVEYDTVLGAECEVCRDATGGVIHSSCSDLSCSETTVMSVAIGEVQPRRVPCQLCQRQEQFYSLGCDLDVVCDGPSSGSSNGIWEDPTAEQPGDACGRYWMQRMPVQCGGNPWERWWRDQHPDTAIPPLGEGEVIRAYYAATPQVPIAILAYRVEQSYQDVCLSCDCPRGDVVYAYVSAQDAARLEAVGWWYAW